MEPSPKTLDWRFFTALLLLHVLVVAPFRWEEESFLTRVLRVDSDLAVLLALGWCCAWLRGTGRVLPYLMAILVLLAPIYRFGHTIMPVYFEKEFDPLSDISMVDGLVHLLSQEYSTGQQWLLFAGVVVLGIAFYWLVTVLCRCVLSRGSNLRASLRLLVALQVLVLASWSYRSASDAGAPGFVGKSMYAQAAHDLTKSLFQGTWRVHDDFANSEAAALQELSTLDVDLSPLEGTDVHILFLESYGRGLFRAEGTTSTETLLAELEEQLVAAGIGSCSTYVYPSVQGGNSALAHAEFVSGVRVPDRRIFHYLLESRLRPLPLWFKEKGYEVIDAQPATEGHWPQLDFFGFTKYAFQEAYGYEGPPYHFGQMPDQFALQHLLENEILNSPKPVFVLYASVISHAPFNLVPPYFEDWSLASRNGPEHWQPARTYPIDWLNYHGHPDTEAAFRECIAYSLRCATGFARRLRRPFLAFVLGDHQPPLGGRLVSGARSSDVPLHVLTNRPELLERFEKNGFTPGLVLPRDAGSFASSRFLFRFFRLLRG